MFRFLILLTLCVSINVYADRPSVFDFFFQPKPVVPTTVEIAQGMKFVTEVMHVSQKLVGEEQSKKWFQVYFETLDSNHRIFTQEDIQKFESRATELGSELGKKDLSFASDVYEAYLEKIDHRMERVEALLEEAGKTTDKIVVELKPKEFVKDESELDARWVPWLAYQMATVGKGRASNAKEAVLAKLKAKQEVKKALTSDEIVWKYLNALAQSYDSHSLYFEPSHRVQLPSAGKPISMAAFTAATVSLLSSAENLATIKVLDLGGQKIGVIDLPLFYMTPDLDREDKAFHSATMDVAKLIEDHPELDGIVLDLRRNPGGYVEEALGLAGLFLGKVPVMQVTANKQPVTYFGSHEQIYGGPLVVLTDRMSASASELLSAAIQDYGRGVIIGDSSTYGKGTMQAGFDVARLIGQRGDYGSALVTMSGFYRVTGKSVQFDGVRPDVVVPSGFDMAWIGEKNQSNALILKPLDKAENFEEHISNSMGKSALDREAFLIQLRRKTLRSLNTNRDYLKIQKSISVYRAAHGESQISLKPSEIEVFDAKQNIAALDVIMNGAQKERGIFKEFGVSDFDKILTRVLGDYFSSLKKTEVVFPQMVGS